VLNSVGRGSVEKRQVILEKSVPSVKKAAVSRSALKLECKRQRGLLKVDLVAFEFLRIWKSRSGENEEIDLEIHFSGKNRLAPFRL